MIRTRNVIVVLVVLLLTGCAGVGDGAKVHDHEQKSYEAALDNFRAYSLNMLAVFSQERLQGMKAMHTAVQQNLIAGGNAQKVLDDELQYQATLNVLQQQVMDELEKIIKMERDAEAARKFHDVVQKAMANADRLSYDAVLDVASAFTDTIDLDLGPLSDFFDNLKSARGLPEVSVPDLIPEK